MLSEALSQHGFPAGKGRFPAPSEIAATSFGRSVVPGMESWLETLGLEAYAEAVNAWADELGAASLGELADELPSLQQILPLKPLEIKRLERQGATTAYRICAEIEGARRASGGGLPESKLPNTNADLWDAAPPIVGERMPSWLPQGLAESPSDSQFFDNTSASQSFETAAKLAVGVSGSAKSDQAVRTITSRGIPRGGKFPVASATSDTRESKVSSRIMQTESEQTVYSSTCSSSHFKSGRDDARNSGERAACATDYDRSFAKGVRIHKASKGEGKERYSKEKGDGKGIGKLFREQAQRHGTTPDPWHTSGADPWSNSSQSSASKSAPSSSRVLTKAQPASGSSIDSWSLNNDPWHTTSVDPWSSNKPAPSSSREISKGARPADKSLNQRDGTSKGKGKHKQTNNSTRRDGIRVASLQVDTATRAAGLDVLWLSGEGYLIEGIDSWPGQPDLHVGEVIRAIGGVGLDDARSEQEIERRFASAFGNGAVLEVVEAQFEKQSGDEHTPWHTAAAGDPPGKELEFTTKLQVCERGAGISLVWHRPEGYLVEEIEASPGQPGLRCGDVIRAIGTIKLYGCQSEEEADAALSAALVDGISLRVFRPHAHCRLGDILTLHTAREMSGGSPILVPSLGIGTWSWGNDRWGHGTWGTPSGAIAQEESLSGTFWSALDAGAFLFDTAPTYGRGFAEHSLGSFCSEGRHVVIGTKYFPRPNDRDLEFAMINSAKATIKRLKVDGPLHLFQLHKPADPPTSLEQQADALAAVVRKGFALAVGVCNFSLEDLRVVHDRLRRTHKIPLSTCQIEFSLLHQLPLASGLLSACHSMGIVVLAYSPLGMGRLTSKHDPLRGRPLAFGRNGDSQRPFGATLDDDPAALDALLKALESTGRRYGGRSVAQVALNWVFCQGAIALAGARTRAQAEENTGSMGWRLNKEDVASLAALGARGVAPNFQ